MSTARKRFSLLTLVGELLLLGGLGTLGFIAWQPWYTANVVAVQQAQAAQEVSAKWDSEPDTKPSPEGQIPVPKISKNGDVFAVMHVPRFGKHWANQVAGGGDMNPILDSKELGIAHYDTTAMPGENGNIVLAAHRSGGQTTPFRDLDHLRLGDPIYLETPDGWYTYRFRSYEYVLPDAVDVLNPFPRVNDAGDPTESILTFTTCNPKYYGLDERMIGYSVFEKFTPRSAGAPTELTKGA